MVQVLYPCSDRDTPASAEEMAIDVKIGYKLLFSGTPDRARVQGLGITISSRARAALQNYQGVSSQVLTVEFLPEQVHF